MSGYACPVCELPQQDGVHLAHHLAITASVHGDDHETWLNTHAPDWPTATPEELANTITPHADPADYPAVFDDTTTHSPPTTHPKFDAQAHPPTDPDVQAAIDRARTLTTNYHPDADTDTDTDTDQDDRETDDADDHDPENPDTNPSA